MQPIKSKMKKEEQKRMLMAVRAFLMRSMREMRYGIFSCLEIYGSNDGHAALG